MILAIIQTIMKTGGVLEMRRGSLQGELLASCTIQSTNGEWTKQSFEVKKLRKKEKVYFDKGSIYDLVGYSTQI